MPSSVASHDSGSRMRTSSKWSDATSAVQRPAILNHNRIDIATEVIATGLPATTYDGGALYPFVVAPRLSKALDVGKDSVLATEVVIEGVPPKPTSSVEEWEGTSSCSEVREVVHRELSLDSDWFISSELGLKDEKL